MILTILFLLGLLFYFLPSIIAYQRGKKNFGAILAVNFLLGWSIIGWIVALVWALATESVDIHQATVGTGVSAPAAQQPTNRLCGNCGKYSVPESKFCSYCGRAFS
jgi:hypothetical protein